MIITPGKTFKVVKELQTTGEETLEVGMVLTMIGDEDEFKDEGIVKFIPKDGILGIAVVPLTDDLYDHLSEVK